MDPSPKSRPEATIYVRPKGSLSGPSTASSIRNPSLKKTSSLNPRKSSSLQNLFHLKSQSRSVDFDSSERVKSQPKDQIAEAPMKVEIRASSHKSKEEKVKALPFEEEKKEVYCKLKVGDEYSVKEDVLPEMKRLSLSGGPGVIRGVRRKSIYVPQNELRDFLVSNGAKVVAVDMPPFMQIHAVDCARRTNDSLEKFSSKSLALTLKKEFDGIYGPAWHCIVGISFGSFVTHSVGGFMYFTIDQKLYILLFKTTVQRA